MFLSPRDLPNPEIKPRSPALQADSLPAEPQEKPKIFKSKFLRTFGKSILNHLQPIIQDVPEVLSHL